MSNSVFAGKLCIVTGAASGLGRALSGQLAAAGARVVLADIDAAGVAAAAAAIVQQGGQARAVQVDVCDAESVRALVQGSVADGARLDYLFNNAGTAVVGEIRDLSLAQWHRVIDLNLYGGIHGIHWAYPLMLEQGGGHIVNIASGFGMAPGPLNAPYVASKFGMVGLSHALRIEAQAFGVDVSVVCPGFIRTALMEQLKPLHADAGAFAKSIPFKYVEVEEAARIVLAGVARKQAVIAFPGYVGVLTFLYRFMPWLYARIGLKQVADFRKIRVAPDGP